VPVFTGIESKAFRERFGSISALLPAVPIREQMGDGALVPLARAALVGSGPVADAIALADLSGRLVPCMVEVFFNQRNLFVVATPRRLIRRGRRIRLAG
jgi:hypothetical protein